MALKSFFFFLLSTLFKALLFFFFFWGGGGYPANELAWGGVVKGLPLSLGTLRWARRAGREPPRIILSPDRSPVAKAGAWGGP